MGSDKLVELYMRMKEESRMAVLMISYEFPF